MKIRSQRFVFASLAVLVAIGFARGRYSRKQLRREAAAVVQTGFSADLKELEDKFVGLAEAIPPGQIHVAPNGRRALCVRGARPRGARGLQLHPEFVRCEASRSRQS